MAENICVTSYNSTGLSLHSISYIQTLLMFTDILCLQEHFLLNTGDRKHNNTDKLFKTFGDNYDMYIVPAIKDNSAVTRGQGSGGLCTMWKKCFTKYVSKVKCNNHRLRYSKFNFPTGKLLLFNTYFMCDPRINDFEDEPLLSLLEEIREKIVESQCSNILLSGDLNASFDQHTTFTTIIKNFFDEMNLTVFWLNQENEPGHVIGPVAYTHTHVRDGVAHYSTLDHFVSSQMVYNSVTESGVIFTAENPSAHDPIYTRLEVGQLDVSLEDEVRKKCPSWSKASDQHKMSYKHDLQSKLNNIEVPESILQCKNVHCTGHSEDIDEYCADVLDAVDNAAWKNLPVTGGEGKKENKHIVGWNEMVKPYQDEANFGFQFGYPQANLAMVMFSI